MPNAHRFQPLSILLVAVLACLPGAAQAEDAPPAEKPTSGSDRLFLAFIEDAAVVEEQWWEGQVEYSEGNTIDSLIARGVVAFQPWENIEVGGRVGFGTSDTSAGLPDGTGATDLDVWGKYYFGSGETVEFSAGSVVRIPTGDDTAGLGEDAFAISGFGAMRKRFSHWVLAVHAGLRYTEDGAQLGTDLDGQGSTFLGVGALFPLSDRLTVVGEARFESERFDGADNASEVLGGVNWRPGNRGMIRGAVGLGLSDGSPDFRLIASYAVSF